jgi:hypothetical protein
MHLQLTANIYREPHGQALDKVLFADKLFSVIALPRATLGKPFVACISHSANPRFLAVKHHQ